MERPVPFGFPPGKPIFPFKWKALLISTRTKTSLDIYFSVIIKSDNFKTALEVALQFFPGIKLKRENRNCASKACLSNEKTSSSGFCRFGISDWLFHRPALSIGQKTIVSRGKTELSLLRVFAELLQLHFHKCCLPLESLKLRDR